ncbi:glycosyltransferase [Polycladidibacter hongkongensis]|uniref:glycosyltransferase n=1 Tax=Polycladidibacter hongkongensis TaxID=1647556 RepID=UPI00082D8C1D|nr:glycosyltransferase [Pseudovibrio hongkongensis]
MRICILLERLDETSACFSAKVLARGFAAEGHEVFLIVARASLDDVEQLRATGELPEEIAAFGLGANSNGVAVGPLGQLVAQIMPSLVYSIGHGANILAVCAVKIRLRLGVPVVLAVPELFDPHPELNKEMRPLVLSLAVPDCYGSAAAIVCFGDGLENMLQACGHLQEVPITRVYPPLLGAEVFAHRQVRQPEEPCKRVVVQCGQEQDLQHLRHVLAHAFSGTSIQLVLAVPYSDYGNACAQMPEGARTAIFPYEDAQLRDEIAAASVFVNCCRSRQISRLLVEALAHARPVVCHDVGISQRMLLDGLDGFVLVRGERLQELAAAAAALAFSEATNSKAPRRAHLFNAHSSVMAHLSLFERWEDVAPQLLGS